jgi:hypothetical protein
MSPVDVRIGAGLSTGKIEHLCAFRAHFVTNRLDTRKERKDLRNHGCAQWPKRERMTDHRLLGATPPPAPAAYGLRPRFALPTRHPPGAAPLALRAHLLNSSACGAVHDEEDKASLSPQTASFKVTESTQRHHSVRRAENKADRFTPRGGSTRSRRYARRNLLDREPMFS